jgi:hypothetical protein
LIRAGEIGAGEVGVGEVRAGVNRAGEVRARQRHPSLAGHGAHEEAPVTDRGPRREALRYKDLLSANHRKNARG